MIEATFEIKFYEPWSGAYMIGRFKRGAKSEEEVDGMIKRYTGYYKETYGDTAKVTLLSIRKC